MTLPDPTGSQQGGGAVRLRYSRGGRRRRIYTTERVQNLPLKHAVHVLPKKDKNELLNTRTHIDACIRLP